RVILRVRGQQPPPRTREMADVSRAGKQPLDLSAALVPRPIRQEAPDVRHGRDLAGQVEVEAAQKLGVVTPPGRPHFRLHPARRKQLVDAGGQPGGVGPGPVGPGARDQPDGGQAGSEDSEPGASHLYFLPGWGADRPSRGRQTSASKASVVITL